MGQLGRNRLRRERGRNEWMKREIRRHAMHVRDVKRAIKAKIRVGQGNNERGTLEGATGVERARKEPGE